jgi:putative PIN family toxin of toxin-antitoxin system
MIKLIIDSNIWISFLIGKSLNGLAVLLNDNKFKVITCDEQIGEMIEVFAKPKLQKYFSLDQKVDFLLLLETKAEIVKCTTKLNLCRDKKDNYLLNLAVDSKSDFLITGDNDLLVLKAIQSTQIINFKDFEIQFLL